MGWCIWRRLNRGGLVFFGRWACFGLRRLVTLVLLAGLPYFTLHCHSPHTSRTFFAQVYSL